MSFRLDGKIALVTGGCSGLGLAMVRSFVTAGARVIVADIQDALGGEISAASDGAITYVHCDVSSEDEIRAMMEGVQRDFGGLDILCNNAGVTGSPLDIRAMDGASWDSAMALLLRSVALGTRYAIPLMIARGGGSIINTSSTCGIETGYAIAYSTAKAAIIHLTRCAAASLSRDNIRVNTISPGLIMTPILRSGGAAADGGAARYDRISDIAAEMQPIRRAGEPDDIANAALYLASDASSFVTGMNMIIDGGMTLGARHAWDPASPSPLQKARAAK